MGMFAKISLTAAFLLMVAPPIACASNRPSMARTTNQLPHGMVLAQDAQPNLGTSDNNNDNDSSDSADDNQNADSSQTNQNGAGDDQQIQIPPTVLGGPDGDQSEPRQVPQMNAYPQPMNPNQQ
jgi:hypothetical protein